MHAPVGCVLLALASHQGVRASPLTRERTLIITRHGIRVPFPPFEGHPISIFSRDSSRPWLPDPSSWGAAKIAALTAHGKKVIQLMGAHFAATVLPPKPYDFTVYSDLDHTNRDIQTAEAFMRGAWPEKNFSIDPWDLAHPTYMALLFNQGNASASPCTMSGTLPDVIKGEIGGDFERVSAEASVDIMRLNGALDCCTPDVCKLAGRLRTSGGLVANCTLMDIRTYWEGRSHYWEDFRGPISVAASLIEYLQLMYLNGLDWQAVARGSNGPPSSSSAALSATELRALMHMHERIMGIADDHWNAQHAGSELLVHMAATLLQRVEPSSALSGLRSSPSDRLVYYAGHDINIYLLRRLLGLSWLTDSYNPDESPPGGFLTIELYSMSANASSSSPQVGGTEADAAEGGGGGGGGGGDDGSAGGRRSEPPAATAAGKQYFVKIFFMSQSYDQQRHATPLTAADPASRAFALIPSCASGPELSCPFPDFKRLVLSVVRRECVRLVDPSVLE